MKVAFVGDHRSPFLDDLIAELKLAFVACGHELMQAAAGSGADIIVNSTSAEAPRANYMRTSARTFVNTLAETAAPPEDLKKQAYMSLVRTLSNLGTYIVHDAAGAGTRTWFVTPELGFSEVPHDAGYAAALVDKVLALAGARLVIENELVPDLPAELWQGDATTEAMKAVGRELARLKLLPSILPIRELLSEREQRLIMKLFGLKQASYGNLSARRAGDAFWMTGRGVDKGLLDAIGRDILLVTGYDRERSCVRVSVPPGTSAEARVSVDAIEHYQIYSEFPGVGAIIHVHAWLDGIAATQQSYPCGSQELADEVLGLVRRAPEPERAVIGLRNHGITATGPDIESVFARLDGRLMREVPMW